MSSMSNQASSPAMPTKKNSQSQPALRQKDFPFGREWNGKTYSTKRVRPVFVEEATEIVIVTVYTYYI